MAHAPRRLASTANTSSVSLAMRTWRQQQWGDAAAASTTDVSKLFEKPSLWRGTTASTAALIAGNEHSQNRPVELERTRTLQ
jgi:hypothetical protein